jgi:hypothetical protein
MSDQTNASTQASERKPAPKAKRAKSSFRHTRAIQEDRSKRPLSAPPDEAIEAHLAELIQPALYAQLDYFRSLGLRQRLLTLPVMVAFVLSLLWRQMGSVADAVRSLHEHGLLWANPVAVSQQAVSERLRTLPAGLFQRILLEVLPQMHARHQARKRPLGPLMAWAQAQFGSVWVLDGSTLDALLRKVGLLRAGEGPVLAGRMAGLLDAASGLPRQLWYEEESQTPDLCFWPQALAQLPPGCLLLIDLGFTHYGYFDQLSAQGIGFITRLKSNAVFQIEATLQADAQVHDALMRLGGRKTACSHQMRLVEIHYHGYWYRYLTNVLAPERLPALAVAQLYRQRWRIEDAFNLVKRLLGLAYFWVGSSNGVQLQLWATWLLYAVLIDLTDGVAEQLQRPFADLSVEMVFRGLYHFTEQYHKGRALDPVEYLAQKAQLLGILKRKRRPKPNLTPAPDP